MDMNTLSAKRELFFRQDGQPVSTSITSNTTTTTTSTTNSVTLKESIFNKEKEIVKDMSHSKESDGYVGFANLPNQVYRKAVKRGFEFTLMVVGVYYF
ncbi:septin-7-like [Centruroides sculpturatus]|uniref:septin-7-like n=1 Tax=Centruroides sculpturatus TaxID=218467 RepID=UPI000C6E0861|nr:septin-7-like [Centruroides sculpturatus]XP_023229965.1 septin-7-like [Centruroides sculpturatus]